MSATITTSDYYVNGITGSVRGSFTIRGSNGGVALGRWGLLWPNGVNRTGSLGY